MKKLFASLLLPMLFSASVMASGIPVNRETADGQILEVTVMNEGELTLYVHVSEVLPATIPLDPLQPYTKSFLTYYVSKGEAALLEVHCANYRRVLKGQMKDKPGVTEKIGRKGYKMNDLQRIVDAYNAN